MRRLWIAYLLPLAFCVIPLAVAAVIFAAIPPSARTEYLVRLRESGIDWLILALGGLLFTAQTCLSWLALRWKGDAFDETRDDWITHLAQAAEWFPLLGLLGTVAAILQTFGTFTPDKAPSASQIIQQYGPAITATGSGLFMALMNILPSWIVIAGRKLIRKLAGRGDTPPVVPLTPVAQPGDRA